MSDVACTIPFCFTQSPSTIPISKIVFSIPSNTLIPTTPIPSPLPIPSPSSPPKMSSPVFISPTLPKPPPLPQTYHPPHCSTRPPQVSRRAFLSLLPLPLLLSNFPDIDPGTSQSEHLHSETADSLLHTRQQRYGITDEHTHATHEDYLRASHASDPPRAAAIALARTSVLAFVAAFSAFGMAVSERESLRNPLPRVYDREAIERYFRVRPDKVIKRMALFAWETSVYVTTWVLDEAMTRLDWLAVRNGTQGEDWAISRIDHRVGRRAKLLRETITRLGTAVIKLGQAAASRQDLLGVGVVKELQRLQDDILDFFPTVEAFAVVEQELGAAPQKLFRDINPRPVAGASLGMVFKARVEDTFVAVKVQRPEVAENVALDCYIVRWMASAATVLLNSRTNLADAVDEYASRLFEELDYVNELENMDRFRQLYGGMEGIYVPKAFPEYCSRRVLVTEWVDGVKLVDDDAKVRPEDIGLVKTGIRFALTQLLDKGFLHADMHNGNMLRTKSGYLAYIDFGLVSDVPVSVRESIVCALLQLIHGEYKQLAESFSGLAVMNTDDLDVDLPLLSEALRSALEPTNPSSNFTLIGIVGKLLTLGTRFRFVFNDYFLNNLRCLGMLEGLALSADPNFSILQVVYPYVAEKLLVEKSERFRRTLSGLVIDSYGRMRWNRMERLLNPYPTNSKKQGDVLQYLTSAKGSFLREYLAQEYASSLSNSLKHSIDNMLHRNRAELPNSQITKREGADEETQRRTVRFFKHGRHRLSTAARLLPGLAPALLAAILGAFRYAVRTFTERVRGNGRRERVVVGWRAFESRFLRKCRN